MSLSPWEASPTPPEGFPRVDADGSSGKIHFWTCFSSLRAPESLLSSGGVGMALISSEIPAGPGQRLQRRRRNEKWDPNGSCWAKNDPNIPDLWDFHPHRHNKGFQRERESLGTLGLEKLGEFGIWEPPGAAVPSHLSDPHLQPLSISFFPHFHLSLSGFLPTVTQVQLFPPPINPRKTPAFSTFATRLLPNKSGWD